LSYFSRSCRQTRCVPGSGGRNASRCSLSDDQLRDLKTRKAGLNQGHSPSSSSEASPISSSGRSACSSFSSSSSSAGVGLSLDSPLVARPTMLPLACGSISLGSTFGAQGSRMRTAVRTTTRARTGSDGRFSVGLSLPGTPPPLPDDKDWGRTSWAPSGSLFCCETPPSPPPPSASFSPSTCRSKILGFLLRSLSSSPTACRQASSSRRSRASRTNGSSNHGCSPLSARTAVVRGLSERGREDGGGRLGLSGELTKERRRRGVEH